MLMDLGLQQRDDDAVSERDRGEHPDPLLWASVMPLPAVIVPRRGAKNEGGRALVSDRVSRICVCSCFAPVRHS